MALTDVEAPLGGPSPSAPAPATGGTGARRLIRAVPPLVSAFCLGLLVWLLWDRWPAVWRTMAGADASRLAPAWAAYGLAWYAVSTRTALVFRFYGIHQSAYRYFLYTLIAGFFSMFLPGSLGGNAVKASYAAGRGGRVVESFAAVFVDHGINLVGIVLIGSVALFFYPWIEAGPVALLLVAGGTATVVAAVLVCRVDRWVEWGLARLGRVPRAGRLVPLARATLGLLRAPRALALALGWTLVATVLAALTLWSAALALGIEVGYPTCLVLVAVIALTSVLPSLQGIGLREATVVVMLQGLVPEAEALALAITYYGVGLLWSMAGGGVFLLRKPLGVGLSPAISARIAGK